MPLSRCGLLRRVRIPTLPPMRRRSICCRRSSAPTCRSTCTLVSPSLAQLPDTEDRWLPSSSRHVLIAAMLKWIDDFDASRRLLTAAYTDWWDRQLDGLLMPALFQLGELECWAGRIEQARKLAQAWRRERAALG